MDPKAEIDNKRAARIRARFLPKRSVIVPAIMQPRMVPSSADETTHPNRAGLSWKCICRKELQPEIIAVS